MIVISGAAGFIGMHTCIKLLSNGHKVLGLDNLNKYYDVKLPKLGCKPQQIAHGEIHGRYFYMLTCNNRNQLFNYLTSMNIECKIFSDFKNFFSATPKLLNTLTQ